MKRFFARYLSSWLVLALSAVSMATLLTPSATAAAADYEFRNQASSIQASGGVFSPSGPWSFGLAGTSGGQSQYVGTADIAVYPNTAGGGMWCKVRVTISTPAVSAGPVVSISDQQGRLTAAPIQSVGTGTPSCTAANATMINGTVTIKGTAVSNPGDQPRDETPGQKEIIAKLFVGERVGGIGSKIQATISRAGGTTVDNTQSLSWPTSAHIGTATWARDPGTYRVCIIPADTENAGCQTVTKVFGKPLNVTFGSEADVPRANGQRVNVTVRVTVPPRNNSSQTTYGPVTIEIKNSSGTRVGSISTDSTEPEFIDTNQEINLRASIDNITATGRLEACIQDTSHCTTFTKDTNREASVIINISAEDSADLVSDGGEEEASSCQVTGGLSWVLCPVMRTVAEINDSAFDLIQIFLKIPPMMTTGTNNGAYEVWKVIRNISNVAFAIVFLIIIYSQLTSAGISNYGVKKMLPKLLVGIILVNTSFWIVALMVDLSNVVGGSIYQVMQGLANQAAVEPVALSWQEITSSILAGGLIGGVAIGVAAKVGVMVSFSVLLPLGVSALFMIVGLMFVLTFRHAMVFILAVIAPLAFVAYLLPNTDGLFKTWFRMLRVLLYIYPAIAFIIGASNVAAAIVFATAQGMGEDQEVTKVVMMLIAVAMPAMGIFAGIMLAKTMGSVLGKLGVTNPFSGMINAAKSRAGTLGQRFDDNNATKVTNGTKNPFRRVAAMGAKRRAVIDAQNAAATRNRQRAAQNYLAEEIGKDGKPSLLHKATGGKLGSDSNKLVDTLSVGTGASGRIRVIAEAKALNSKELMEDINNIMNTMDKDVASDVNRVEEKFQEAVKENDVAAMAAYQKINIRNGSPGVKQVRESLNQLTDTSGLSGEELKNRNKQILDLKDILSSDDSFQRAGRDFEVWSNNEHSVDGQPHANFAAVTSDLERVWEDISAQRFASMNKSSQMVMIGLLQKQGNEAKLQAFVRRMMSDSTAMGQVKEEPQKFILDQAEKFSVQPRGATPAAPSPSTSPQATPSSSTGTSPQATPSTPPPIANPPQTPGSSV